MSMECYQPINGSTVSLSVTSSNTPGTITPTARANRILIQNLGPSYAYFRTGTGAQTATTSDTVIQAGQAFMLNFNTESLDTGVAAICDTGLTATVKVSQMYVA